MRIVPSAAVLLLALAARSFAGTLIADIPEIGPHYRVVTIEKSVHPQNLLVAYTRLDEKCRIVRDPKQGNAPVFDFYWLMDGSRYKRVHPLIKRGIRRRLEVGASPPKSRDGSFSVRLNDFTEVEHDLGPSPLLWVRAEKTPAGCRAETRITLGPSDQNAALRLDSIYSEAELAWPLSARVKSITLKGVDANSGKSVVRTYRAK
jgi:hypothetical protein